MFPALISAILVSSMDSDSAPRNPVLKRNSTACEHCRAAKAKCQPSEQPGVCRKCLASRRECVSRTKARPRRARRAVSSSGAEPSPEALGQSSTFSINYFESPRPNVDDGFATLREVHNCAFDNILDVNDTNDILQTPNESIGSTPANQSRSLFDTWRKPQFNLASAEALLNAFNCMVNYIPFITLPAGSTVSHVAATKPFILLAVLTVASRSRTVQKHSLYDEEFLRVLGLKYVSGGERSIQLLQGLLIYCAWYPFHLKPKSAQLSHCIRMAADIIHELGLDENFVASDLWGQAVTEEELDKIRAYLAYVYLVSTYVVVWKGERCVPTRLPPWASIAVEILEQNAQTEADRKLAALVRLSILGSDVSDAMNERVKDTVRNSQLILVGLEQRYQQIRTNILASCPGASDKEPIRMQIMFLDIFFDAGSLLTFPVAKPLSSVLKSVRIPPLIPKIYSATKKIRVFLEYVGDLDDRSLLSFTVNDWTRLIIVLTLAFRLSFPLGVCPDFDWTWANSEMQLDQFLSKVSREADTTVDSNGILSANRVVFGLLKSKFNRRLSSLSDEPVIPSSRTFGCPMMSGGSSLADAQWSSEFAPSEPSTDTDMSEMVFHDMWTAVATGWQDVGDLPWESFDEQLNSVGACAEGGWSM
ncbi:hypothetical protein J3F83DRAFT_757501 [Trichoderma novae-zelandiae]